MNLFPFALSVSSLAALIASPALGQGGDCSSPIPLTGVSSVSFQTVGAGASSFSSGIACAPVGAFGEDLFYQWTSDASGHFIIDVSSLAFDTQVAVHSGSGCAAICIDHDDGLGNDSRVGLSNVNVGDTFLIRIGGVNGGVGTGNLTVLGAPDPCTLPDDPFENNDTCNSAPFLSDGTHTGLIVHRDDRDIYRFQLDSGATVACTVDFLQIQGDVDIFLRNDFGPDCGTGMGSNLLAQSTSTTDDERLTWTNSTGSFAFLVLEVHFVEPIGGPDCNLYDLSIQGTGFLGGSGERFCDPMDTNSSGRATTLFASANANAGSGFQLSCFQGPPGEFGYFLVGNSPATPGMSLGAGRLCLDTGTTSVIGRYNQTGTALNSVGQFDNVGFLQNLVSTGTANNSFLLPQALPFPGAPAIQAGETWHFQVWHRDQAPSSNLSNGLSLTF